MMWSTAPSADSGASDPRHYLSRFTQLAVTREQEGARRHGLLGQDPYTLHDSGPPERTRTGTTTTTATGEGASPRNTFGGTSLASTDRNLYDADLRATHGRTRDHGWPPHHYTYF